MTIAELVTLFRSRVRSFTLPGQDDFTPDGTTLIWPLTHRNVVSASLTYLLDGITQVGVATLAADTGIVTLSAAPVGTLGTYTYNYYDRWSDSVIHGWLAAGAAALYPEFYTVGADVISLSPTTYDYAFPAGAENVTVVHTRASSASRWIPNYSWDYDVDETLGECIHFRNGPGTGQAKLRYITRPSIALPIADTSHTIAAETGLATADATRAEEALILYLKYCAAADEELRRVRSDKAITFAPGNARIADFTQIIRDSYSAFVTHKQAVAMQPYELSLTVPR